MRVTKQCLLCHHRCSSSSSQHQRLGPLTAKSIPVVCGLWSLVLSVYVSEGSLAAGQLLALLTLLAVYRVIRSSCQTHAGYGESSLANRGGCGGVAVQTSYRPQERRQGQLGLLICLPKVAGPNPRPCHHRILIGITGTPGTRSHGQIAAIGKQKHACCHV